VVKTNAEQTWPIKKTSIRNETLYEQVSDALEDMIIQKGDDLVRLPTEYQLAQQFGVSRSVIREALKLLKERGLVTMRAGDGSYTVRPGKKVISHTLERVIRFNRYSDDNITEVRMILEMTAVQDAAVQATDSQIDCLEKIEQKMESEKNTFEKRVALDCEFHEYIASIGSNQLLASLVDSLMDIIKEFIRIRLEQHPEGNELGIMWHRKIIEAIKAHDSAKAGLYMRQHITDSFHQLDKGKT
jgi:GntR family transcriptional repressor for pyruvate dehydrogenase complex